MKRTQLNETGPNWMQASSQRESLTAALDTINEVMHPELFWYYSDSSCLDLLTFISG